MTYEAAALLTLAINRLADALNNLPRPPLDNAASALPRGPQFLGGGAFTLPQTLQTVTVSGAGGGGASYTSGIPNTGGAGSSNA